MMEFSIVIGVEKDGWAALVEGWDWMGVWKFGIWWEEDWWREMGVLFDIWLVVGWEETEGCSC